MWESREVLKTNIVVKLSLILHVRIKRSFENKYSCKTISYPPGENQEKFENNLNRRISIVPIVRIKGFENGELKTINLTKSY